MKSGKIINLKYFEDKRDKIKNKNMVDAIEQKLNSSDGMWLGGQ